ncbi:MAG: hypothetical protein AB2A00_22425 [Myxococcota bacterium]
MFVTRHSSLLPCCALTLLTACASSKQTAPRETAPAPATAPSATSEDCTLETPLVEGVPGSPGHLLPSDMNPNGVSELAALMRDMLRDVQRAREDVVQGRALPSVWERHRRIRCAWPTTPSDRNASFDAAARAYLDLVHAWDAQPARPREAFNHAVQGCLACHAQSCPGPVAVIEPLLIPDATP